MEEVYDENDKEALEIGKQFACGICASFVSVAEAMVKARAAHPAGDARGRAGTEGRAAPLAQPPRALPPH